MTQVTVDEHLKNRDFFQSVVLTYEGFANAAEYRLSVTPSGQFITAASETYLDISAETGTSARLVSQLDGLTTSTRTGRFWRGDSFRDGSPILKPPAPLPNVNGGMLSFFASSAFAVSAQYANQREYFGLAPDRMDYSSPEAYRESIEQYRDNLYETAYTFIPGGGEPVGTYEELFGPPHVRAGFDVSPFWRNSPSAPPPPPVSLTPPTPPPIYTTDRGRYLDRVDLRQTFHTYRASGGTTQTTIIIPGEPTQDYTEESSNGEFLPDGDYYQRVYFPESENIHWARPNEIAYFTSPCGILDNPGTGCIDSDTAVCISREYETYNPGPRYNFNYSDQFGYAYELEYSWSVLETVRMKHAGQCYVLGYATHSAQIVVTASDSTVPLSGGGTMRTTSSGRSVQYATNPVAYTLYFNDDIPDPIPPPPPPPPPDDDCDCMSCNCCPCGTIYSFVDQAKTEILNELRAEVLGTFAATNCDGQAVSHDYTGVGVSGLAAQNQAQFTVIKQLLASLCGAGGESTTLERVYKILGGDTWFQNAEDTTPTVRYNPEGVIETARVNAYPAGSPAEIESPNLLSVLAGLLSVNHHRQGHHEYPVQLPSSLWVEEPAPVVLTNEMRLILWLSEQLYGLGSPIQTILESVAGVDSLQLQNTDCTGRRTPENLIGNRSELIVDAIEKLSSVLDQQNQRACSTYAAIPEWWQTRLGADRPQLVLQFAERYGNGRYGPPKYPVTIPHYRGGIPDAPPIPSFSKGQYHGVLILTDNSKVIVNCQSATECNRVLDLAEGVIGGGMTQGVRRSIGERRGRSLDQITVYCRVAKFFPQGQLNTNPDWVKYFD